MFSKLSAILLIVAMLFVIGCAAHIHKVGLFVVTRFIASLRKSYI